MNEFGHGLIDQHRHGLATLYLDPVKLPDPSAVYARLVQPFIITAADAFGGHSVGEEGSNLCPGIPCEGLEINGLASC